MIINYLTQIRIETGHEEPVTHVLQVLDWFNVREKRWPRTNRWYGVRQHLRGQMTHRVGLIAQCGAIASRCGANVQSRGQLALGKEHPGCQLVCSVYQGILLTPRLNEVAWISKSCASVGLQALPTVQLAV